MAGESPRKDRNWHGEIDVARIAEFSNIFVVHRDKSFVGWVSGDKFQELQHPATNIARKASEEMTEAIMSQYEGGKIKRGIQNIWTNRISPIFRSKGRHSIKAFGVRLRTIAMAGAE